MSIKDKYKVRRIKSNLTYEWLLKKHYAKRIPSISFSFGLYDELNLIGVMTIGKPASNSLCVGVCGETYSQYVYELNRLCVNDGLEKNVLSYFLSSCLRMIDKDIDMILISYADSFMGHHGYIYQATNWIYTGLSAKRTEKYDPENLNRHSKSVTESISKDKYKLLPIRDRPRKHRYIKFLGKNKKHFESELKYDVQKYPKGNNLRYDASTEIEIQQEMF